MTRAVTVHTTSVEKQVSNIPQKPARRAVVSPAAAWAMAEDPTPASLVKTPRATPYRKAAPAAPPQAARGVRAQVTISRKAGSSASRRSQSIAIPAPKKRTAMTGTTASLTRPTPRTPPKSTAPTHKATPTPTVNRPQPKAA